LKLSACILRRPRHQSTCNHFQRTRRAKPAKFCNPDLCIPGISASSSCELVFREFSVKITLKTIKFKISPANQLHFAQFDCLELKFSGGNLWELHFSAKNLP